MSRRPFLVTVIVLVLLAAGVTVGVRIWADAQPPEFTASLLDEGKGRTERVELDDGSELAVTVTDSLEFVVQWRAPGGSRWTAAEEVVSSRWQEAHEFTLASGGSTALLGLGWYGEYDDSREDLARTAVLVCRDYTCGTETDEEPYNPMISDDGEYAVLSKRASDSEFGSTEFDYDLRVGTAEDDRWESLTVEAPDVIGGTSGAQLVLLADGSLATARGHAEGDGCRVDLWKTAPRAFELHKVSTTTLADWGDYCEVGVFAKGDEVEVYGGDDDYRVRDNLTFTPDREGWTARSRT